MHTNPVHRTWASPEYVLAMLILGLMGAFFWAIRGTAGYGGETGGMLAGFGWALLWYALSRLGKNAENRPYGHPWSLLAITLGIALGGFTGYGVYISWVNGHFYQNYPELSRDIPPWTGYAMLFACGWHWGGNTGCFLAWCAPKRPVTMGNWTARIACGLAGAVAAAALVRLVPHCFLPFYNEGIYSVPEYKTCQRALLSIQTIAPHVGSVFGFLAYEAVRKDWRAVRMILTVGLGFAIPFTAGGVWHTMHDVPLAIDWWKNWEMTIGLGGGLSLGLAFWLFNRPEAVAPAPMNRLSQAFFRSGFPLWLPTVPVLQGAYDGWCELHAVPVTSTGYALLLIGSVVPFIIAYFIRRRRRTSERDTYQVSFPVLAAFLALIIAMGYLTSIPPHWRFGNAFLVTLYTGYIGVSALLFFLLWRRTN